MRERFEIPQNNNIEKKEDATISEDEILRRASEFSENESEVNTGPEEAREIVGKIEEMPTYQEYKNIDFSLKELSKEIEKIEEETKENENLKEILSFLQEEIDKIKTLSHRYNKMVRAHERSMRIENFRLGEESKKEKIEKYDRNRRICHDNLVSSFEVLRRHLKETLPEKFDIHPSEEVLPSDQQLQNRDFISDWARLTATGEELENYKNKLATILEEEGKEEAATS